MEESNQYVHEVAGGEGRLDFPAQAPCDPVPDRQKTMDAIVLFDACHEL